MMMAVVRRGADVGDALRCRCICSARSSAPAGAGILFAALIVTYRDVRYVMTFVMQLWLFGTPVLYTLDIIPAKWHTLYALNPMVGMIAGFRASVLGGAVSGRV